MTTQVPNAMLAFDGGALGFRNRLINGAMMVDQRNAGATQTFTAAAAIAYCIDRWYGSCTGANVTGARSSVAGGYTFTGAASNTGTLFGQRIESSNVSDLVSANVMCQIKVSSSTLTSITWNAYYANSVDTWSSKTLIATGSLVVSTTPTVQSLSFNTGANAANGVAIEFVSGALLAGQTLTYGIAQLEAGTAATAFERKPYSDELARCMRYYQKSYDDSVALGTATRSGLVMAMSSAGAASYYSGFNLQEPMRVAGTFSYWDGAGNASRISYYEGSWTDNATLLLVALVSTKSVIVSPTQIINAGMFLHYAVTSEL